MEFPVLAIGEPIKEEFLSDFLKSQGITEVELAGELGPYKHNYLGCVGDMYKRLRDKIPVVGIRRCIFPFNPDKRWTRENVLAMPYNEAPFRPSREQVVRETIEDLEGIFMDLYGLEF